MKKNQLAFYGLAMELVALIAAFAFAGNWLDENYGLKGLGVAGGCFLALFIWIFHILKSLKQLNENEQNKP